MIFLLLIAFVPRVKRRPDFNTMAIVALLLLVITFYTMVSPKRGWPHYLLFASLPMAFMLAVAAGAAAARWTGIASVKLAICILILAVGVVPLTVWRVYHPNPWVGNARAWHHRLQAPFTSVGLVIAQASQGTNGFLAVWGYNPNYNVETGLKQSTRLSISSPQFNENSMQEFFRAT